MKQFEYDIRSYPMDKKASLIGMQDDLNAQGRDGWEVVSVSSSEFAHIGHTVFLKREMRSGHSGEKAV